MNGFGQNITNITDQMITDNFKSETTYTGYVEALNEKQQRHYGGFGIQFKGNGFYKTDNPK